MNWIGWEYDSFRVASRTHMFGPHMKTEEYTSETNRNGNNCHLFICCAISIGNAFRFCSPQFLESLTVYQQQFRLDVFFLMWHFFSYLSFSHNNWMSKQKQSINNHWWSSQIFLCIGSIMIQKVEFEIWPSVLLPRN